MEKLGETIENSLVLVSESKAAIIGKYINALGKAPQQKTILEHFTRITELLKFDDSGFSDRLIIDAGLEVDYDTAVAPVAVFRTNDSLSYPAITVHSDADAEVFAVEADGAIVVGNPTGGSKGSGSINAESIFVNGESVDYVFDRTFGSLHPEDRDRPDATMFDDKLVKDIDYYWSRVRSRHVLPMLPTRNEQEGKPINLSERIQQLTAELEIARLHIQQLHERLLSVTAKR